MIICILFLLSFTFSIYATHIPPNCTVAHGLYAKSVAAVPPMWTCPEGSPRIWRQQLCDNFFNCRHSLGDEKICVDYGPYGSSNITIIDEKVPIGHSATPVVPRIYLPDIDCSAPICVSEGGDIDLIYKAHLICRQTGRITFQRLALISNSENRWPVALSPDVIRCAGHETTIQQCSSLSFMKTPFLINNCSYLLALSCANECAKEILIDESADDLIRNHTTERGKEGMVTSLGFPNYFLPHLDCTWTLTISNKRRIFVLNVTVLNLQEFDVGYSGSTNGEKTSCANSYVEIGLGLHRNGTYIRKRICHEDVLGMNFTSFGNRIYVRYVSGQYLGTVMGEKGFALSYYTVDDSILDLVDESGPLTPAMIVLISMAGVITVVAMFLGAVYCFNKSKFRAKRVAKRRRWDMVKRLDENRALPMLRAPNEEGFFPSPVICSICNERIVHVSDLCQHYARILQYVTDIDYMALAKTNRPRRQSHNSNVTIDIDELMKADRDLRKQQKRWRSMDVSCIDSAKTAMQYESTLGTSYAAQLGTSDRGSERRIGDLDDKPNAENAATRKISPQLAAKNAAAAVRNFLTTAVVHKAKSSFTSWRTPSPRPASVPEHLQCPEISIRGPEDAAPTPVLTAFSLTPRLGSQTLSVSPVKVRTA